MNKPVKNKLTGFYKYRGFTLVSGGGHRYKASRVINGKPVFVCANTLGEFAEKADEALSKLGE